MDRKDWLLLIINAALAAGQNILDVYHSEINVTNKEDNSPLTEADKQAHLTIIKHLKTTGIPIISEEGEQTLYNIRKDWKQFWLVDPLDGTKEFIKRNGEFTVNIALIENGKPTMGVVYIPVTKELYFSDENAYKINCDNLKTENINEIITSAQQLPIPQSRLNYIIAASRSHLNQDTVKFIEQLKEKHKNIKIINKGSSLKLCLIAEGSVDVYPRFSPTMEWDIAAGHAIINAAGANVIQWNSNSSLLYNKEDLLNPSFIALRD